MANEILEIVKSITNLSKRVRKLEAQSWKLPENATAGELYSQFGVIRNLQAFWPCNAIGAYDTGDTICDISGNGHHLWTLGAQIGMGYSDDSWDTGFPYASFSLADYAGREYTPRFVTGGNGFSVGGWFRISSARTTTESWLMNGNSTGDDRAWRLGIYGGTQKPGFQVSPDGTNGASVWVIGSTMEVDKWYFIWAQWRQGLEMYLFQNGVLHDTPTGTVPATVHPTTSGFGMAAEYSYNFPAAGKLLVRCAFVALEDDSDTMDIPRRIFQATRGWHGV